MTAKAPATDGPRPASRDQGRVLVIGDEQRMGDCTSALEAGGFFVAGVAGGAKALIALQRTRPHAVVADTRLRGVSAAELARILLDAQDAVPFALAGDEAATLERRRGAMTAGAADYFQLPAEVSLLIE